MTVSRAPMPLGVAVMSVFPAVTMVSVIVIVNRPKMCGNPVPRWLGICLRMPWRRVRLVRRTLLCSVLLQPAVEAPTVLQQPWHIAATSSVPNWRCDRHVITCLR